MGNPIKSLISQTAAYGMSSIVGRLIGYLLVPFYTRIFLTEQFGVFTELLAYVGFLLIILTYGMETGFFRFSENKQYNKDTVYSTILSSVFTTSLIFAIIIYVFYNEIGDLIGYSESSEYILLLGLTIAIDAFSAIPFASLRLKNKVRKFVSIKIANILISVFLNLFFLYVLPNYFSKDNFFYNTFYEGVSVGYIFISFLLTSLITLILLLPELFSVIKNFKFDFKILKKILAYSIPLLFAGLAGMISESLDKILLKHLLTIPEHIVDANKYVMSQLGIYGANVKIAVLMTLFIQAFRYAAEPFFFSYSKNKDAKVLYAKVMKYFIIFSLMVFLGITLLLDFVKIIITEDYYLGLDVIPILLLGKMFFGIVFNLSIWYKLTNKTKYGFYLASIGAIVTIILNFVLVPIYGFYGSAWAGFFAYFSMMIVSFLIGKKYYPIKYDIKNILIYLIIAVIIYFVNILFRDLTNYYLILNFILLFIFLGLIIKKEKVKLKLLKQLKK